MSMSLGPRPLEQVKYEFVRYTRGHGLDVGYGAGKAFPHIAAVRLADDEECERLKIRDIVTTNLGLLPEVEDASCDFILAANVMSKVPAFDALAQWLRCIKAGGYLCIYEPVPEAFGKDDFIRNVMHVGKSVKLDVVRFEPWPPGGNFIVLRKREDDNEEWVTKSYAVLPPPKRVCVVRHGGIGDQLQAAYLLPELKRQGYHVTMLTTPNGKESIEHDPHIDDWYMVDRDQVPNAELAWFWSVTSRHYDKFVNLNESVERVFLAPPGTIQHTWPKELRHQWMNGNYAEHAAAVAEVPFVAEGQFYTTEQEEKTARNFVLKCREDMNKNLVIGEKMQPIFTIMWVLAGSSPHKFTPHQDVVLREILHRLKRAVVVLVGGMECKILEAGWEDEPRLYLRSGEMSVRATLALAKQMDLVIGPETGVMNAVCYEPMKKVLMLSHSSQNNLSKHWVNTTSIAGRSHCHPCHRLHFTAEFCPQDPETGAALCQRGVRPEELYEPIDSEYTGWARAKLLLGSL
jgi:ADP-heptose:LPS heptosyltransferase